MHNKNGIMVMEKRRVSESPDLSKGVHAVGGSSQKSFHGRDIVHPCKPFYRDRGIWGFPMPRNDNSCGREKMSLHALPRLEEHS